MDYPQMPEQIDATKDDFNQLAKIQQQKIKTGTIVRWTVAIFLTLCILALTWQQYTSFGNIIEKIILPLAVVYAGAFLPGRYLTQPLNQNDIWYKEVRATLHGGGSMAMPASWQGWLIDFGTILLCLLNIILVLVIMGIKRKASVIDNANIGEFRPADSLAFLLKLTPILIILFINFWIRNRHTQKY